ncbi:MAG: HAD family hydrolase [Candidatus Omnitrophota bacterium]
MIKAILFDLGKVILDFNFEPAFRKLSKATGLTPEEIRGHFSRSGLEVLYDGGKISSRRFYREVKKALKHPLSYEAFKKIWNNIFTPKLRIMALVKQLSRRTRLVLISNTNAMHYDHVRRKYPIFRLFDRHILSFKEKVRKPDERIYRRAIAACKAKTDEIFYIDDREDLTTAADALGLRTFTFKNNPDALVKRLKKEGILPR